MPDYLALAKEAYESSTTYFDQNIRDELDYSLRAFRNEHAASSKYSSEEYKARSRVFRPKTRSIIRKNEAAGAVALFSNMDVVNVTPGNPDNNISVASAAAMKEILEYRLSKTIPAFPLVMGAIQDAQAQGAVCSYQYWEYQRRADGRKVKDRPCIELRPLENIRLDGGANWLDPINTSPYLADIIPMYVCDVKGMMENKNDKTAEPKWKKLEDSVILKARPDVMAFNRLPREKQFEKPGDALKNFDIVWVLRWFMKDSQGNDHVFYTMGTEDLLTDEKPIEEVYFHGKRPYVLGCAILETHKALKPSIGTLVKPLQQEVNDIANQRLDNVKFVLNKRWLVARGRQVDVQSLVRNVPGGVTLLTDPKNDVVESNWADVTSSSYVEQDRLASELDDLAGNFSPSTKVANNAVNDTVRGSQMAAQGAGLMSDYLLRTIIETWWEPTLRQLVLLEQYYETDEIVLSVCANKAKLFPRFGMSKITDDLLMNEVNVSVNVGMGSSNPTERTARFLSATSAAIQLVGTAPPGANVQEMIKEIYSNAGYRDGSRFWSEQVDPRLLKAMQTIHQLTGIVEGKQMEIQAGLQETQMKLESTERIKGAELQVDAGRISGDLKIRESETAIEAARVGLDQYIAQLEAQGMEQEQIARLQEMSTQLEQAQLKLQEQNLKNAGIAMKVIADRKKDAVAA